MDIVLYIEMALIATPMAGAIPVMSFCCLTSTEAGKPIRDGSGDDSVPLDSHPLPPPPGIWVPASTSSETTQR